MTSEPNASVPRSSAGTGGASSGSKEELERLEAKLAAITDPDIRKVLSSRIEQLREEHAKAAQETAAEEPVEEENLEPPTPQQLEEAEVLLRQAQVEKMRGNKQAVADLLGKAKAVAPTSWQVLTAIGDDAAERRKFGEARDLYAKALKVSPKNVALEKKHAEAVFRTRAYVSIEDQMRLGMGESPFLSPEDAMASRSAAMVLNAVLPGMGQIYLGYTKKGVAMLLFWLAALVGIAILHKDLQGLTRFIAGGSGKNVHLGVMIPAAVAAIVYFIALADVRGKGHRRRVDRPIPPVNLPFD